MVLVVRSVSLLVSALEQVVAQSQLRRDPVLQLRVGQSSSKLLMPESRV
jgi:hypothetical protein